MGRNYGETEKVHTVSYHQQVGRHIRTSTPQHEIIFSVTFFWSGTNIWLMLGGSSHLFPLEKGSWDYPDYGLAWGLYLVNLGKDKMLDFLMIQLTNGWLKPPFELQRENFHYFGSFSSILREMLPLNREDRGSLCSWASVHCDGECWWWAAQTDTWL